MEATQGKDEDKGNEGKAPEPQDERPKISKYLYQLIIGQLRNDGFYSAAEAVSSATLTPPSTEMPQHRLAKLVTEALQMEHAYAGHVLTATDLDPEIFDDNVAFDEEDPVEADNKQKQSLDMANPRTSTKSFPNLTTKFITTHKGSCRISCFSNDGKLVATGSSDTSIKVLDVQKMRNHSQGRGDSNNEDVIAARPVIRTFYDHTAPITDMQFHPCGSPILISSSRDCTIKFFDLSKVSNKRSFRYIQDTHCVRSISFHPSGDFVIAGTDHPMIRLYDVQTFACFTASNPSHHHTSPINQVRFHEEGALFASCAKDGSVKLWDGVTNQCVRTMSTSAEATSVRFSRNGQYLLTGSKDFITRLWEVSTGREVMKYKSSGVPGQVKPRVQSVFSPDEDFVMSFDQSGKAVSVWEVHTGKYVTSLAGHHGVLRWIAVSPAAFQVVTCSEDYRARFWTADA
eukprot:c16983_g1_i2.p1 GENE.c16983_g1_i2~~c16983_g1_i2.p1  ORF type:complete len:457 (+),score=92.92 c16983_g1_i2:18-1388(+)